MKNYEIYKTHELNLGEKYDFFIYSPHAGYDKEWINFVKSTLKYNEYDDNILHSYMKHEADFGVKELALGIFEKVKNNYPEIKLCVGLGLVPRAFCDLNYDLDSACPPNVKKEMWKEINDDGIKFVEDIIKNSKSGLNLHTMNSRGTTFQWIFGSEKRDNDLINYLENCFSGEKREDNLITSDEKGNYLSNKDLDNIFRKKLQENNIKFEENKAYFLEKDFFATDFIKKIPSSLIEVSKGNLGTTETKDSIDASHIVIDQEKLNKYVDLIVVSILEFLHKKIIP